MSLTVVGLSSLIYLGEGSAELGAFGTLSYAGCYVMILAWGGRIIYAIRGGKSQDIEEFFSFLIGLSSSAIMVAMIAAVVIYGLHNTNGQVALPLAFLYAVVSFLGLKDAVYTPRNK